MVFYFRCGAPELPCSTTTEGTVGRKKAVPGEATPAVSSRVTRGSVFSGAPTCAKQVRGGVFTTVLYVATSHYCLTAELLPNAIVVYPRASTEREICARARLNRRPAMIWLKKIFVCLFC